jgi:two-component system NtrC family sensor kinase
VAQEGDRPRSPGRVALYLPALALFALNLYLIPLRGALRYADPVAAVAWKDRLEILVISSYGTAAAALLLLRLWTATRSKTRWRLKWLALSAVAGLLPLALFYGLPVALGIPPGTLGELSLFPLCLVPLGCSAALFQDRAVDLDFTLRGAARWTLFAAVFLGASLALSWGLGHLPEGGGRSGVLREVMLPLLLSALLAVFLRPWIWRTTDAMLGTLPPGVSRTLLDFRSVLNADLRVEDLGNAFLEKLRGSFQIEAACLLVREGTGSEFRPVPATTGEDTPGKGISLTLGRETAALLSIRESILLGGEGEEIEREFDESQRRGFRYLFPMVTGRELQALLLTGPHRDGSPLAAVELEALAAISAQAARGIEGARLYREIRERMEKEEALREQSRMILEASRIGILLADGGGMVTQANRSAGEILGNPDCAGRPLASVLPRGLLLLLDRSGRLERSGEGRVFRYSFGGADGRKRTVNVTRARLGEGPGEGQVYTLDDITEEVRREEKMLRQDHLASVGLLASQVAHEVNTPLTGIASYAQMLMSRLSSRLPEMDLLRKIEAQAFRAAGIAGSVLSFSRRREGERNELMDAGPVVAECLTLFETQLKGKRIRMTTERAASLPAIHGHRGRIQQAVMNLLMNAAAALPGGGEVRLGMDREGEFLRIRVADNGIGIPADIVPRIFEPFFTARPDGTGTGLGLSVVRQVMEEHGGRVSVESVPGAGSTFTLLIPAAQDAAQEISHGA